MAWTSSAAQSDRARHFGASVRDALPGAYSRLSDLPSQSWLKLATLLNISLLAAAIPLGPEFAIVAITSGSAIMFFVVLHRDDTATFTDSPHLTATPHPDHQRQADVAADHAANALIVVPAAPHARPTDLVWRDIMGHISHELRTPLNAIIGFSDLMGCELHGPMGDPRYQQYLEHIRNSGRSLLRSAEDTLTLTELLANRDHNDRPTLVAIDDLIHGALNRLKSDEVARIRFDGQFARDLEVQGERRALHQSVLNVVEDALERIAGGSADAVAISVRDTGARVVIEITARPVAEIADATSLRMTLARMMLELNGGSLDVATIPGAGWRAAIGLDLVRQPDLFRH